MVNKAAEVLEGKGTVLTNPDLRKWVGIRMRRTRENAGVSVEREAEALGVSPQMVNYWETGRSFPSFEHFMAWLVLFQVSSDWLLGVNTARINELRDEKEQKRLDEEELLLANFRNLEPKYRGAVSEVARALHDLDGDQVEEAE